MRALSILLVCTVALLLSASPGPGDDQPVYDNNGVLIGWVDVGTASAQWKDNPNTSHPPDTALSNYGIDANGVWHDSGNVHSVYWTNLGGGCWSWVKKKDSTGQVVDSGYLNCPPPPPAPAE